MALAACGDGEGDDAQANAPAPPPASGENQAPTISGKPSSQVMPNTSYAFTPTAADADGDELSFSIDNAPPWATFDAATGRLSGTPEPGDLGLYSDIVIRVSDGEATTTLASFSVNVVATASGSATLTWVPPTQKTDGTPVDLASYKIYWGTSSRQYTHSVTVDAGLTTYVIEPLTPDTWYFSATALDSNGVESEFSNEASKEVL